MNILVMDWPAFGQETIKKVFAELGHTVYAMVFPHDSSEAGNGELLCRSIAEKILETKADAVFSFNFFPVIAMAAQAGRAKYISWVYDNPASYLYSMTVFFPGNYIFHFDSHEAERMRREGIEHAYYFPLAANTEVYDGMQPEEAQRQKYHADIAMIGSLYGEKYAYFDKYIRFDEHLRGFLDGVVNAQEGLHGVNFLESVLSEEILKLILNTVPLAGEAGDRYDTPAWKFANYYLAMRVTEQERRHMLEALSQHYDVALYTGSKVSGLERVRNMGSVEYYREAPIAMKCAKINLNITLRSIQTGIPLRVMDIMGCGGFVLSNYQEDLCREFVPDEDFVYYESIGDAVEKAAYYLEHDEERLRIAENGYRKVKRDHNFQRKCRQILAMVTEE
ncbi:MAG: glycosyltransferase [Lachnospiraceae bacterium]|nr:glycosyltransferase [Lachnospiraceae bacterium]